MVNWKKFDGDLLLTTVCPVECDFCVYSCSLDGEWMPEETIERVAKEYTKNDVGIRISGGEPLYNLGKFEKCLKIVLKYQRPEEILVISSGFFGLDTKKTNSILLLFKKYGLDTLVLSVDRFHEKRVPLKAIENILKKAKLKIILRLTTDEKSYMLMDYIADHAVKYKAAVEVHHNYGDYGKAELLDKSLRSNEECRKNYFINSLKNAIARYKTRKEPKDYIDTSPKRSQRKFAARFYPTTFPNGNVYADSQCCRATFMGNINRTTLKSMKEEFKKTMPGYILLSENSVCQKRMKPLLPVDVLDTCDYCRNYPFKKTKRKEYVGREYVLLDPDKEFTVPETNRELLLAFDLKEKHLNLAVGKKIIEFLNSIDKRFIVSRPLPRCLFGTEYSEIYKKHTIPTGCYDCKELFHVDDVIHSCRYIGKKGPKLMYMEDRNQIWEFFNTLRLEKQPSKTCMVCRYFRRRQCDGMCFRQ